MEGDRRYMAQELLHVCDLSDVIVFVLFPVWSDFSVSVTSSFLFIFFACRTRHPSRRQQTSSAWESQCSSSPQTRSCPTTATSGTTYAKASCVASHLRPLSSVLMKRSQIPSDEVYDKRPAELKRLIRNMLHPNPLQVRSPSPPQYFKLFLLPLTGSRQRPTCTDILIDAALVAAVQRLATGTLLPLGAIVRASSSGNASTTSDTLMLCPDTPQKSGSPSRYAD